MTYLVIFQNQTEQFAKLEEARALVLHLKEAGIPHTYTLAHGSPQPKKHKCLECGLKWYTYQLAKECCT